MLILWLQTNVIIDQRGRPRLTEYRLAPINSDPSFTVAATPGAVGTSRWLAPEIINPARRGITIPVRDSKAADVFAFGMFAVEVFTGKVPFEEQRDEAVVLRISQGGRPEMPQNAQEVGLTDEMWRLFESCWRQNPKKRPTMPKVVRKWQRFVGNDDDLNTFSECVQTILVILSSLTVLFQTLCDSFREPQSAVEPVEVTSRRRAKTEVTQPQPQPQTKIDAPRTGTMVKNVRSRGRPAIGRLGTTPAVIKTGLGAIPQSPNSDTTQQSPKSEVTQQRPKPEITQQRPKVEISRPTQVYDPPSSTSTIPRGCQFQVLIHQHNSTET